MKSMLVAAVFLATFCVVSQAFGLSPQKSLEAANNQFALLNAAVKNALAESKSVPSKMTSNNIGLQQSSKSVTLTVDWGSSCTDSPAFAVQLASTACFPVVGGIGSFSLSCDSSDKVVATGFTGSACGGLSLSVSVPGGGSCVATGAVSASFKCMDLSNSPSVSMATYLNQNCDSTKGRIGTAYMGTLPNKCHTVGVGSSKIACFDSANLYQATWSSRTDCSGTPELSAVLPSCYGVGALNYGLSIAIKCQNGDAEPTSTRPGVVATPSGDLTCQDSASVAKDACSKSCFLNDDRVCAYQINGIGSVNGASDITTSCTSTGGAICDTENNGAWSCKLASVVNVTNQISTQVSTCQRAPTTAPSKSSAGAAAVISGTWMAVVASMLASLFLN